MFVHFLTLCFIFSRSFLGAYKRNLHFEVKAIVAKYVQWRTMGFQSGPSVSKVNYIPTSYTSLLLLMQPYAYNAHIMPHTASQLQ